MMTAADHIKQWDNYVAAITAKHTLLGQRMVSVMRLSFPPEEYAQFGREIAEGRAAFIGMKADWDAEVERIAAEWDINIRGFRQTKEKFEEMFRAVQERQAGIA